MAEAHKVKVEIRDLPRFRLHAMELRRLVDRARVEANPLAPELEAMLKRFTAPLGPDERAE